MSTLRTSSTKGQKGPKFWSVSRTPLPQNLISRKLVGTPPHRGLFSR
ncbi:hypothetical protein MTR67_006834 [Solanum verrucosum]|uniref:Uncharacterized protein n=1 Tax=Solanum verrucosum TaxID=315347 RepID=A0AAF0TCJ4_SOLVR|nr:hypothetical protein MTR67_006834 [Solanum verrucosum]